MNGMTEVSDEMRQFLTTEGNDLSEELLTLLAEELNDPERRAELRSDMRGRIDQIRSDLDEIPDDIDYVQEQQRLAMERAEQIWSRAANPSDTPEPW